MKQVIKKLVIGCSLIGMVGCSNMSNQDIGTMTGGLAGGLLGSTIGGGSGRILAIGAGAVAGALIGGAIGRNMDRTDQLRAQKVFEDSPTGRPTSWQNPDSGNSYVVTPQRTFVQDQQPCREYQMTSVIGGKKQQMYGTACRQADGSWKTQN